MDTTPGFGGVSRFVDGDRLAGVEGHAIARTAGPADDVAKRAGEAVVQVQGGLFGPEGATVAQELPAEEAGGSGSGRLAVEFGRSAGLFDAAVEQKDDASNEIPRCLGVLHPAKSAMSSHIATMRRKRRQLKDMQIPPIPFQKKGRDMWRVTCRIGDGAPYA